MSVQLSVIIITKNEQEHIKNTLNSVILQLINIESSEVILVDSCSNDNTIAIANEYPISIVQLRSEWIHTPSAGRFIGYTQCRGKYIMYLDGDCSLESGFLEAAINIFENNIEIAAISGKRSEIYYEHGKCIGTMDDVNGIPLVAGFIEKTAGPAIFRKSAMDKAGSFNPFLFSEEEAELSYRLKAAGFKIYGLPLAMVVHHTAPRNSLNGYIRRIDSNLHLGPGQILRMALHSGMNIKLLLGISSGLKILAWYIIGCVFIIIGILHNNPCYIYLWIAFSCILYILFAIKNMDFIKPFKYICIWSLQSFSLIRGFIIKPNNPESYPKDIIIIKR
jgi:glycosyltransferase involved in cell wall biosynthesis